MNNGMRIEVAAGVVARDWVLKFFGTFGQSIVAERRSSQVVVAAFVDGLAGSVALSIQGRHGSKAEIIELTVTQFREAVERDLKHLKVL